MNIVSRQEVKAYRTKDGSLVREIVHPDQMPIRNLSLAEARLEPGASTALHYHDESEENSLTAANHSLPCLVRPGLCVGSLKHSPGG